MENKDKITPAETDQKEEQPQQKKKTYEKPAVTSVQPLETRAGSSGGGGGGGS